VTRTAPNVPPRTIIAAVACAMSWMFPFSRMRPPMIPARARAIPPSVARSGRTPPFGGAGVLRLACWASAIDVSFGHHGRCINFAAEFDDPLDDLISGFPHTENLPGGQCYQGVRRDLDVFNQIRVEDERHAVQPG